VIDAALRRTGRLERAMFVPPPTRDERAAILQLHLRDRPTSPTLDLDGLARRTSGFSGADLAQLAEHAADLAIEASVTARREVPIGDAHLGAAADQLTPTTLEWLTTARNHARYADGAHQYREVIEFLDRHGRK
jgi:transitional endoplasmic reticulum ATPase